VFEKAGMPSSHSFVLCMLVFTHFMIQPLSEADHICQTLQVHFNSMLCNVLEKYYSFPGFTLLLRGFCQYIGAKQPYTLGAGILASSYLIRWQGEGHILDDTGLLGAFAIDFNVKEISFLYGAKEFFSYLTGFLKNPEHSGTCFFDQKCYATAAQECLQLYLCSHHNFSKGSTEFSHHDKALCRTKPWEWVARLGVHSRIWKARHHFKVQQHNSVKAQTITQDNFYPENSPEHQKLRSLLYRWALDLLPFFLERSAISLELANLLHSCTFTTMAWKFPRRRRLAKEAIVKYLLQVGSAAGEA
jgi:hypothetical protein